MIVGFDDVAAARRRVARRRWRIVAATAGVVVLAAVSGWLVVGLRPGVATGSVISPSGGIRLNRAAGFEGYVADGGSGTLRVTLRNDGRLPFTVLGLADETPPGTGLWSDARFAVTSASPGFVPVSDAPVTVAPDEEAVIALAIRIPPCGAYPDGGSLTADRVRVRVRSLGLTTTHDVRFLLPLRVTVPPRLAAGPGCMPR